MQSRGIKDDFYQQLSSLRMTKNAYILIVAGDKWIIFQLMSTLVGHFGVDARRTGIGDRLLQLRRPQPLS